MEGGLYNSPTMGEMSSRNRAAIPTTKGAMQWIPKRIAGAVVRAPVLEGLGHSENIPLQVFSGVGGSDAGPSSSG